MTQQIGLLLFVELWITYNMIQINVIKNENKNSDSKFLITYRENILDLKEENTYIVLSENEAYVLFAQLKVALSKEEDLRSED